MEIIIDINSQKLKFNDEGIYKEYNVSTAKKGIGQKKNSFQTPIGKHFIIEKSGYNAPINTYYINRVAKGLIKENNEQDFIVARVLRLAGKIDGLNLNYDCDTYKRMIYIHASHPESDLTNPSSLGCIRMYAKDICELFDLVKIGCEVNIYEK